MAVAVAGVWDAGYSKETSAVGEGGAGSCRTLVRSRDFGGTMIVTTRKYSLSVSGECERYTYREQLGT